MCQGWPNPLTGGPRDWRRKCQRPALVRAYMEGGGEGVNSIEDRCLRRINYTKFAVE